MTKLTAHHRCDLQAQLKSSTKDRAGLTLESHMQRVESDATHSSHILQDTVGSLLDVITPTSSSTKIMAGVLTGISLAPSCSRILAMKPSSWDSHAMVACSNQAVLHWPQRKGSEGARPKRVGRPGGPGGEGGAGRYAAVRLQCLCCH